MYLRIGKILGNFMPDRLKRPPQMKIEDSAILKNMREAIHGLNEAKADPRWPTFTRDPNILPSGVAKIVVSNKKVEKVSFSPFFDSPLKDTEMLPLQVENGSDKIVANVRSGDLFNEVIDFVTSATKEAGLNTQFRIEGNELVVVTN